MIFDLM